MMWQEYNPNPIGIRVGDCVVRAISKVLDQDWESTFIELCVQGLMMCDMPSSNAIWAAYLRHKGFKKRVIPDTCPECYTVKDFCEEHPQGRFVLGTGKHAVAVVDGRFFDVWNSGNETPIYYFEKEC